MTFVNVYLMWIGLLPGESRVLLTPLSGASSSLRVAEALLAVDPSDSDSDAPQAEMAFAALGGEDSGPVSPVKTSGAGGSGLKRLHWLSDLEVCEGSGRKQLEDEDRWLVSCQPRHLGPFRLELNNDTEVTEGKKICHE